MLKDILAISGQPGLYKLVSQARNGVIVESLETKKRIPAYATAKISALEDIAIYTDEDEVPLIDIFKSINSIENGGEAIGHKSSANELKTYFEKVLPAYDRDRVYVSDMKKVINWYNILHKLDMVVFEEEKETIEGSPEAEVEEMIIEDAEIIEEEKVETPK